MEEDLDKKWLKFMEIGKKLGCHQRSDRSFSIKGYQFPVCARCTGVLVGYVLAIPTILFLKSNIWIYISVSFCSIMFIDWYIQFLRVKESTNFRRFITGILGGIGIVLIFALIIKKSINIL